MKLVLERAIAVGDTRVAALVGQTVHRHTTARCLVVTADKRPMALLIGRGDQMTAFTPSGELLAAAQVESWCPGATAAFMNGQALVSTPRPAVGGSGGVTD